MAARPARNLGTSPSRAGHPLSSSRWRRPQTRLVPRAVAYAATALLKITTGGFRNFCAASPSVTFPCFQPTPPPSTQKAVLPFMSASRILCKGPLSAQVPARMASTQQETARVASTDGTTTALGHAPGPQSARAFRNVGAPAPQTDANSAKSTASPSDREGVGDQYERKSRECGGEADGNASGGRGSWSRHTDKCHIREGRKRKLRDDSVGGNHRRCAGGGITCRPKTGTFLVNCSHGHFFWKQRQARRPSDDVTSYFQAARQLASTGSRGPGPLVRRAVGVSPDRLLVQTQACHIRWSSPCHAPEVIGAKKSTRRQPCLPGFQQVRLPTKSLRETL